jgi:hypothetical protein
MLCATAGRGSGDVMARMLYCWRCRTDLPMLDEAEWAQVSALLAVSIARLHEYREVHASSLPEALERVDVGREALDKYREFTGYDEANVNALPHHRASLYGPPCARCGKPLRTPRAKLCAACGALKAPA